MAKIHRAFRLEENRFKFADNFFIGSDTTKRLESLIEHLELNIALTKNEILSIFNKEEIKILINILDRTDEGDLLNLFREQQELRGTLILKASLLAEIQDKLDSNINESLSNSNIFVLYLINKLDNEDISLIDKLIRLNTFQAYTLIFLIEEYLKVSNGNRSDLCFNQFFV